MPTIAEAVAANEARIATQGANAPSKSITSSTAAPPLADPPTDRPRRGNLPQSMIAADTFEKVTGQFYGRMRARVLTNPAGSDLPANAASIGTSKTTVVTQVPVPDLDPFMQFRGQWAASTTYFTNDVVIDNLSAYVAIAGSTGVEPDKGNTQNWALLSKNLNFRGVWVPPTASVLQNANASSANGAATGVTFSTAVQAGSAILVTTFVQNIGNTTVPVITDTQGNTYSLLVASGRIDNNQYQAQTWIATTSLAGSLTVNVTWTGGTTPGFGTVLITEIGNISLGQADQSASAAVKFGAGGGTFPAMIVGATNAGEFIYTAALSDAALTAPTGYSSVSIPTPDHYGVAWTQGTAQGSNSVQWQSTIGAGGGRVLGTAVTFIGGASAYNPFDYVEFEGSMWVCVKTTGTSPSLTNTSWQLLAQGAGFVNSQTANYLAATADQGRLISFNSASAVTLTLPSAPPNSGWWIAVENIGTGSLTINPNGLNLDGSSSSIVVGTNLGCLIFNDGFNYFTFRGLGSPSGGVNSQTASYLAVGTDTGKLISMNGSNLTLTLPATPPNSLWHVFVENLNATNLTISPNGLTLDGSGSNVVIGQNQGTVIFTDGTNYFTYHGVNALVVPAIFTVTVPTISGVVTIGLANENAKTALMGPVACSSPATPTFRQPQGSDLLNLSITSVSQTGNTTTVTGTLRSCGSVLPQGLYRVTVYMLVTQAGAGNLMATITWNDGTATQTVSPASISTAVSGVVAEFNLAVLADGVHDVSYTFTLS